MTWLGFTVFCVSSLAAFFLGLVTCRSAGMSSGQRTRRMFAVLVALLTSVWLRYNPLVEAAIFPVSAYAHVRPWWSIVLGLGVLGSAVPQLDETRKLVAVGVLAAFLFVSMAERFAASARISPEEFAGIPSPEWKTCGQSTPFSCGAAAASTLLARMGIRATEAEMAERCLTNPFSGTDEIGVLKGLGEKLAGSGHEALIERVPLAELSQVELPAMACTNYSFMIHHWVIVLECDGQTATVADPLSGDNRTTGGISHIALSEFEQSYRGVLVRIQPKADTRSRGELQ